MAHELDDLRLVALGRIPRCAVCPRYRALVDTHRGRRGRAVVLPGVPQTCRHEVCAPMVGRLTRSANTRLVASAS